MLSVILFSIVLVNLLPCKCASKTEIYSGVLHRSRRQLLFPNSTLLQFNAGIGTPSPAKDVNVNLAFQANFQLPWNRTQIPIDILHANSGYDGLSKKKRDATEGARDGDYENDAKLFHFYKYVEELLNGFGHNGKSCVMQSLCQIGAEPLYSEDEEDLLHELATFVLDPTNDDPNNLVANDESYPYIQAYRHGQRSRNCTKIFENCSMSLLDVFTKLHDASA